MGPSSTPGGSYGPACGDNQSARRASPKPGVELETSPSTLRAKAVERKRRLPCPCVIWPAASTNPPALGQAMKSPARENFLAPTRPRHHRVRGQTYRHVLGTGGRPLRRPASMSAASTGSAAFEAVTCGSSGSAEVQDEGVFEAIEAVVASASVHLLLAARPAGASKK